MNLIKVNRVPSVFSQMDSIFDNFFNTRMHSYQAPNYEVLNNNKEYTILMDVPGIEKSKMTVECLDCKLSISGNRNPGSESNDEVSSLSYGEFKKEFSLPDDVIEKDINAKLRNGVLEITLPRQPIVKSKAQKITIK